MKHIILTFSSFAFLLIASSCSGPAMTSNLPSQDEEVNIGYGTVSKRKNTGSVSKVKVKDNDANAYTNMIDYLRGRVPGLNIDGSGRITIRGINSINSDTTPLFILDGVETPSIDYIDPHMVSSVDVIKDGSSAIYGVKGANGVIIITTKKALDD